MHVTLQSVLNSLHLGPPQTAQSRLAPNLEGVGEDVTVVYRYRKQRGVNLGSWFVLERWITDAPFRYAVAPGQSDLDVAKGSHAKEILERHWDSWITGNDFKWLASRGINAVRIPIGYYHLCGIDSSLLQKTDFQGLEEVFQGAWPRLVRAVETAQLHGIGVLFDLHSAPGKQNQDSHSGTSSPRVSFFDDRFNLQLTIRALCTLVSAIILLRSEHDPPIKNVIGVELLNEPRPPSHPALKDWYVKAIQEVRSLDPVLPIYISDCWMSDDYAGFVKSLPKSTAPICLDHHLYRCFTSSDNSTPVAQHSASLTDPNGSTPQTFARVAGMLEDAGGALVVGEWSGALNPGSLQGPINEREERKRYVAAQLALFERYCAGWFFWTYKKQQAGDQGWSFRDAVEAGVFPNFVGMRPTKNVPIDDAGRKGAALTRAIGQHVSYWAQYPGQYEHWRFEKGYNQGWGDAYKFLLNKDTTLDAVSELGFKGPWKKKRVYEHGTESGFSNNVWEYEHGYDQAVRDANLDFQNTYC
ncbi:glucan 1,3-beta-glucosidase [Paxillus involutus ATCC 200175]|uniref:Unplaced genomic scaffold PAXINscaffold_52, whole genome shotgun sequence n=1 Tax=Paxillus involutus ATCC 200175 TaxID=664439 RepID=A0A0C9TWP5_PAXIN|nr:glucan 1,3-beta-glucosidase [Paxillus involutus ATCC 200175]